MTVGLSREVMKVFICRHTNLGVKRSSKRLPRTNAVNHLTMDSIFDKEVGKVDATWCILWGNPITSEPLVNGNGK